MNAHRAEDVTELLRAWSDGDQRALDGLTPIVYAELRRLAHRYMKRERPDHSLQTTALVNEAYLRLVDCTRMQWKDRAHFFAVSAQLMRRILVDHARRNNVKRGRGVPHVSFDETAVVARTGGEPRRARRCDACSGAARSAESAGRRNALFRRPQCRRDGGSAQGVAGHRQARLEQRQDLVIPRTDPAHS